LWYSESVCEFGVRVPLAAIRLVGWQSLFSGQTGLEEKQMSSKLYVGNMSYSTSEDELRSLFSQAGTVASVAVIKDRDTGQSKGFGFVEMGTQEEAQRAIVMFNGYRLNDRTLTVNPARPREDRPVGGRPAGGFGGGRGGPGGGGNRDRDRNRRGGGTRRY
jgi:RNA recognition motif-containing protein